MQSKCPDEQSQMISVRVHTTFPKEGFLVKIKPPRYLQLQLRSCKEPWLSKSTP